MATEKISYEELIINAVKLSEIADEVEESTTRFLEIFNTMRDSGAFSTDKAFPEAHAKAANIAKDIRQYIAKLGVYEKFLRDNVIDISKTSDEYVKNLWNNSSIGNGQK